MKINGYRFLAGPVAVAAGAGVASGLLYSLMGKGTPLAAALVGLVPLPIMIAILGFGVSVGVIALVFGCVAVALFAPVVGPDIAGASVLDTVWRTVASFAFMLGVPALWLGYLASRPHRRDAAAAPDVPPSDASAATAYASVEQMVTAAIAIATTIVVLGIAVVVLRQGSLELVIDRIVTDLTPLLDELIERRMRLPAGYDAQSLARMIVLASAPVAAGMLFLVLTLNLWLAGKATRLSGRLQRPWPDVAFELRIPRPYGLLLGAAFATTFVGGAAALIASILAMVLAAAFALQGLAVVHVFSRGRPGSGFLLWIMYGGILVLMPWSFLLFALLGIVESLYSFRNLRAAMPPKV